MLGLARAREIPSTRDRFPLGKSQSNPTPGGRREGSPLSGPRVAVTQMAGPACQ